MDLLIFAHPKFADQVLNQISVNNCQVGFDLMTGGKSESDQVGIA